jgi:hypothetical protein
VATKTIAISQPAVQGWTSGTPRYEANSALTQKVKTGTAGAPGVYDEIAQQWYRVAANLAKGRAFVEQLEIETLTCGSTPESPDGDETPEEARWNDAVESLIRDGRLGIAGADDVLWGVGPLLAQVHDAVWFGFAVWDPYWHDTGADAGVDLDTARLVLSPLSRAACYQWLVDATSKELRHLRYLGASVYETIDVDQLIRISHGGGPGEYFGRGELRPIVGLFHAWRESLISNANTNRAARGRLIVTEPEMADDVQKERINALVQQFDDGRVDSFSLPFGAEAGISYPTGTAPDFATFRGELDQAVDYVFDSRNSALGIFGAGSRAVAETMGSEDDESRRTRWARDVNRAWQRVAAWVASQTGYTGRIRTAAPVGAESVDPGDVLDFVERGLRAQAIRWTAKDEAWFREQGGLLSSEDAGVKVDAGEDRTTLLVGQLQASQQVLQSLASTDPTVGRIAPAAAVELLVAAGIERDNAERMVSAQMASVNAPSLPRASLSDDGCGCGLCAPLADDVDLTPTQAMADAARRALEVRESKPPSERGMTDTGIARARDLQNRRTLSPETVREMRAWFARHEVDKSGETWDQQGKGWQAWHGWGGDAGRAWAERKVKELDRAAMSDDDPEPARGVTGADDRFVEHYRDAIVIELDGETITPESVVTWASDEDVRQRLDAELAARLAPIIDRHRAAVWDALGQGTEWDADRMASVFDSFRDEYQSAVVEYVDEVRDAANDQRAAERDRQSSRRTDRDGLSPDALRTWAAQTLVRMAAQAMAIADTIANRVQRPIVDAWAGAGIAARRTFDPRQTAAGLAREARPLANRTESIAAVTEAAEAAPPDVVVIAAVRSSMKDNRVCPICRDRDGNTYRFPEDSDAFDRAVAKTGPPDPQCEGGDTRCRCRWVLVWGRQN